MMEKPQSTSRSLVLFVLIGLLILLAFGLVMLYGNNLGIFSVQWNIFDREKEVPITINVLPYGSEISINGTVKGETPLTVSVKPGRYKIKVSKNGYSFYEDTLYVQPNQPLAIEYHLKRRPYVELISGYASNPLWLDQNSLFYSDLTDQIVSLRRADGTTSPIYQVQGNPTSLYTCLPTKILAEYIPDADPASAVQHVIIIDVVTNAVTSLGVGNIAASPYVDGCQIYLLGWYKEAGGEDFLLWTGKPDESLQQIDLPNISETLPPKNINMSLVGNWLMIEGRKGLNLWQFDGNIFQRISSIDQAYGAVWSPVDPSLAYMDQAGSIHLLDLSDQTDKIIFSSPALLPLQWMPDGKRITFTTYDPSEGGSSFWALDVNSRVKTLLVDSSLILGRVTDFAISPDGARIAYTNDLDHLNILFIGE